jgi:hypothetical protein
MGGENRPAATRGFYTMHRVNPPPLPLAGDSSRYNRFGISAAAGQK